MNPTHAAAKNHLLAALPAKDLERWLPQLEAVDMPLGEVLYEAGTVLRHVYFPTTSIVSLLYVMQDGDSAAFRFLWGEGLRPAAPWCKTQEWAFG